MHEFSLAQGLLGQLLALAEQHRAAKIRTVRVEIGTLAGVVADSFAFGFEVLTRDNEVTAGAVLEISERDPVLRCLDCGLTVPFPDAAAFCPDCGSRRLARQGGDDLILTQVEME